MLHLLQSFFFMLPVRFHSKENIYFLNCSVSAKTLQLKFVLLIVKLKFLLNSITVFPSLAIELLWIPRRSCQMCSNDDLLVSFQV